MNIIEYLSHSEQEASVSSWLSCL